MASRQELLLAYGIAEYETVIEHLRALRQRGVSVPYITLHRLTQEQHRLMRRWLWGKGDPRFSRERAPDIYAEVRNWLDDNWKELDALLENERKE